MSAPGDGSKGADGVRIAVFTICAANYLPQACVLADSLAACHPGRRLTVFLLDAAPAAPLASPHIDIIGAGSVLDPRSWVHKRCFYDLLELSTSIKPECFLHLLGTHDAAFYFDPDIRLLSALPAIESWPSGPASAVLTPHLLAPLPDDGHRPDNLDILRSGTFNLGFAAFKRTPEAMAFLEWWGSILQEHCLADVGKGVFTDQKWVNFATSWMAAAQVERDPGWNVAYWNLHERVPVHRDGRWHVRAQDGTEWPLRFYHFSGFSPKRTALSKHEGRYGSRPPGDTPRLLREYGAALRAAGHDALGDRRMAPPVFGAGMAWDPICREAYRDAIRRCIDLGDPLQDEAFFEWMSGREAGDRLSRYLRALLRLRSDLGAAYADGLNAAGLMAWLRTEGVADLGVDPALLDRLGITEAVPGVYYASYLRAHLGVAEAARNSIAALRAAGVTVEPHDVSDLSDSPLGAYDGLARHDTGSRLPIAILGFNADVLPGTLPRLPPRVTDAYRIGCWYWETPDFPEEWCSRFDLVDEVWAATEYVARAIRGKATVPVVVMPPMVCPPPVAPDREWLAGLIPEAAPQEFLFLYQFDVASVPFRKNPEGTIEAFIRAFAPQEPVRLVVKLLNGDRDPALMDRLRAMAGDARVSFIDAALDSLDRFRLLASIDCFLSLHRAEGFGLSIAEAMAYGVPVVTTGWSGNADFTTPDNAAIVAFDLRPTAEKHGPYPAGTVWAEPRVDDAARQMRRVVDDPAWRDAIGRAGAETIATQFSPGKVGAAMRARLQRINASARIARGSGGPRRTVDRPSGVPRRSGVFTSFTADAVRFPGYYLSRAPRLPSLLYRHGLRGVLDRAFMASAIATADHKAQFTVGGAMRKMLARIGLGRRWKSRPPG